MNPVQLVWDLDIFLTDGRLSSDVGFSFPFLSPDCCDEVFDDISTRPLGRCLSTGPLSSKLQDYASPLLELSGVKNIRHQQWRELREEAFDGPAFLLLSKTHSLGAVSNLAERFTGSHRVHGFSLSSTKCSLYLDSV